MVKRKWGMGCLSLALCLVLAAYAVAGEVALPDTVEMYYVYDNLCASCDATEEFDRIAAEAMAEVRDQYPYAIHQINVYAKEGAERYRQLCDSMGLDPELLTLPLLIAGGRVFQGLEAIENNMKEAYLVAGEDLFVNHAVYNSAEKKTGEALFDGYSADPEAVTAVYFYRITCEECNETTPVIDALGAEVDMIRINTRSGNNGERVTAFFDAYQVPDEDRMVPIVFTADTYFAGYEAIAEELPAALRAAKPGFTFPGQEAE